MEFDSLKASGASKGLYDRSVLASDVFNTLLCKSCGIMGETVVPTLAGLVREEGFVCRACGAHNTAASMDTTYCYSGLLVKELAALSIGVEHFVGGESKAGKLTGKLHDDI
jgi:DNA-directed RNA polymerase beta subunit